MLELYGGRTAKLAATFEAGGSTRRRFTVYGTEGGWLSPTRTQFGGSLQHQTQSG